MENLPSYLKMKLLPKDLLDMKFILSLGAVIVLTVLILSPSFKMSWRLIDDGENLRMGQEIDRHFASGDYGWLLAYEKESGRFRPAYWLWHFTTYKMAGFNAYRHHLIHLVLYTGMSVLIFLTAFKISRSNLAGLFSVVFFLFFKSVAENFYRLGTAEPQITFLYLLLAWRVASLYFGPFALKRARVNILDYLLIFITLGLSYFMKETAPILILAFSVLFLAGLVDPHIQNKGKWLKFSAIFLVINLFFFLLSSGTKHYYYSGAAGSYTGAYLLSIKGMIRRFLIYTKMIVLDYKLVLAIPIVTFIEGLRRAFNDRDKISLTKLGSIEFWQLVLLAFVFIFLAIQVPWIYALGRYLLPINTWLAIFLGVEVGKLFSKKRGFFLKIGRFDSSFKIPLTNIVFLLLASWFVAGNGKDLYFMYKGVIREERATQNVIRYLADNVTQKGHVYTDFSELLVEYQYELPIHFRFFYSRPDIQVDYLSLEKDIKYQKGDAVIAFTEKTWRYPWEEVKRTFSNAQEIKRDEFGPNWKILLLGEEESFSKTLE